MDISFEATWYQGSFGKTTNTLKPYVYYRNTEDGYWENMNDFINGAFIGRLDETKIDTSTPGVVRYRGQLMSAEDDYGFDVQVAYDMFIGFQDTFTDEGLTLTASYGQPAAAVYKNKMALGGPYDEMLGGTQLWGDIYLNGKALQQSGSTSDIVESGENDIGTYIKYSDGTMICTQLIELVNVSISTSWGSLYVYTEPSETRRPFPQTFTKVNSFTI